MKDKGKIKAPTVEILGEKFKIRPLSMGGVIKLETDHDINMSEMTKGVKMAQIIKMILVMLQDVKPTTKITEEALKALPYNHPVYSKTSLEIIMGTVNLDPLEQN